LAGLAANAARGVVAAWPVIALMIAVIARFELLDEQRQFDARGAQQLSLVGGSLLE
jgi:hypothetical protein